MGIFPTALPSKAQGWLTAQSADRRRESRTRTTLTPDGFRRRAIKALLILRHASYLRFVLQGTAASVEHIGLPFSCDHRTVIDVGANRGQFMAFALIRFPRAIIHSFEPLPTAAGRLQKIARQWDGRVRVYHVALGASSGRGTLLVTRDDDASSLLPLTMLQVRHGSRVRKSMAVDVRPLDDLITFSETDRPLLLKIDVQGFEAEVLRGASQCVSLCDEILIECSFVPFYVGQALAGDVMASLRPLGFRVTALHPSIVDRKGNVLQADILFRRATAVRGIAKPEGS
jgi:FkbM family methyltransferase